MILQMTNAETESPKSSKTLGLVFNIASLNVIQIGVHCCVLQSRLEKVIDFGEDSITFYHLCAACEKQIDRIGLKKGLDTQSYIVLKLFLWAKADRKTLDPHGEVKTVMSRALSQCMIYFHHLRALQKASRVESLRVKAGTARLPNAGTWNQKNLDYEIETTMRLRVRCVCCGSRLEIKRTSITRLKLEFAVPVAVLHVHLKSKEPRLRDWNIVCAFGFGELVVGLKSKEPRLRDWNKSFFYAIIPKWFLEIKRTSITRLKQERHRTESKRHHALKSKEPRLRDWNPSTNSGVMPASPLKSKEPRLRDWNEKIPPRAEREISLKSKEPRLRDWNPNNLLSAIPPDSPTWNQKNLDYEIETVYLWNTTDGCIANLKSKEPRLRDWNLSGFRACKRPWDINLKSKEPRLRDWNYDIEHNVWWQDDLEIKRTSITRLKPFRFWRDCITSSILEIKRTSITRLKR